jgi:hypothetical protein
MHEKKHGQLRSGSGKGKKRKQAIAIAMSGTRQSRNAKKRPRK